MTETPWGPSHRSTAQIAHAFSKALNPPPKRDRRRGKMLHMVHLMRHRALTLAARRKRRDEARRMRRKQRRLAG